MTSDKAKSKIPIALILGFAGWIAVEMRLSNARSNVMAEDIAFMKAEQISENEAKKAMAKDISKLQENYGDVNKRLAVVEKHIENQNERR